MHEMLLQAPGHRGGSTVWLKAKMVGFKTQHEFSALLDFYSVFAFGRTLDAFAMATCEQCSLGRTPHV